MQPGGNEEKLIRMQLENGWGIFACNYAVVISTETVNLASSGAPFYTWMNPAPQAEMGDRGIDGVTTDSYLNTKTFIMAWETLMNGGQVWLFDFVVKVDPDTVFLPGRLRQHVEPYTGQEVYFSNCGKWGGKVLLYGALEVLSIGALRRYREGKWTCQSLDWHGWGEDSFMQHCLDTMNVQDVSDLTQVADNRCASAPCSDYTKAAFHDFKEPDDWIRCHRIATGKIRLTTDLVPRK